MRLNPKVLFLPCLFFLLWLMPWQIHSQSSDEPGLSQQQFITGCAQYRQYFIDHILEAMEALGILSDSLKSYSLHPEAHDLLIERFMKRLLESEIHHMNLTIDAITPSSIYNDKGVRRAYKAWGQKFYLQLYQLHFLISNNIIVPQQPFRLSPNLDFWHEINAYGLQPGDTFIDAGGGIGGVSLILAQTGFPLKIYLTELDKEYIDLIRFQLSEVHSIPLSVKVSFIEAQPKSLGLEDSLKADIILLREVFHHLAFQKEILESVRHHLNKDGRLVLVESTKELNKGDKSACRHALPLHKIKQMLEKAGFTLMDQKLIKTYYVMTYII